MEIIEKYTHFDYFDGMQTFTDCKTQTLNFLGSASAIEYTKAYISLDNKIDKISIGLFGGHNTCWKYLSDFQPPNRGFEQKDLIYLCDILGIDLVNQTDNRLKTNYEILYKNNSPYDIIVVSQVYGGRQPEGVYIHSILFVKHNFTMKQKYFNCNS